MDRILWGVIYVILHMDIKYAFALKSLGEELLHNGFYSECV